MKLVMTITRHSRILRPRCLTSGIPRGLLSACSFAAYPLLPNRILALSFHALTNCNSSNSFVLTFMQNAGGGGTTMAYLKKNFKSLGISLGMHDLPVSTADGRNETSLDVAQLQFIAHKPRHRRSVQPHRIVRRVPRTTL